MRLWSERDLCCSRRSCEYGCRYVAVVPSQFFDLGLHAQQEIVHTGPDARGKEGQIHAYDQDDDDQRGKNLAHDLRAPFYGPVCWVLAVVVFV